MCEAKTKERREKTRLTWQSVSSWRIAWIFSFFERDSSVNAFNWYSEEWGGVWVCIELLKIRRFGVEYWGVGESSSKIKIGARLVGSPMGRPAGEVGDMVFFNDWGWFSCLTSIAISLLCRISARALANGLVKWVDLRMGPADCSTYGDVWVGELGARRRGIIQIEGQIRHVSFSLNYLLLSRLTVLAKFSPWFRRFLLFFWSYLIYNFNGRETTTRTSAFDVYGDKNRELTR